MHSCGKDKQNPGKFAYTLRTGEGTFIEHVGNFNTMHDAIRAAECANRAAIFSQFMPLPASISKMTDDQVLDALFN